MYDLAIHTLTSAANLVVHLAADEGPDPADVKAGWGALGIFVLLCATVAFLGFSLTKQLKKVDRAKAEGIFGEEAAAAGLGVGLSPWVYVAGDIAAGRLVAPLGFAPTPSRFWFLTPAGEDRPAVAAFRDWLIEEAAKVPTPRGVRR